MSSSVDFAGKASDEESREEKPKAVPGHRTPKRASNKGCLPMSLAEYLQLVNWAGRQLNRTTEPYERLSAIKVLVVVA